MTVQFAPDLPTLRRLAEVARRAMPADLVVHGGALVNVFTEELLPGWGVVVAAGRVAYIGPDAEDFEAAERIDVEGGLISPGLVEGHTHLMRMSLFETIPLQLAAGVTTTILESMEVAYITGAAGVRELLAEAAGMPGQVLFTVPTVTGFDELHDAFLGASRDWEELLDLPGVIGVGEVNWMELARGNARVDSLIAGALRRGLTVEGHGAGARPAALNAFAAYGITADHEGIDPVDELNRMRLGMWAMGRHGATRQDLPAIAGLWQDGERAALGRFALVTDGVEPQELQAGRSLNRLVDLAVGAGMERVRAIGLASLAVAERFGIQRWIGALGPGMLADIAILDADWPGFRATRVLTGGKVPADPKRHLYPAAMTTTVSVPEVDGELLRHPGPGRWRAMNLTAPLVTREVETDGSDVVVATVLDRMGRARGFRGLLKGLGLRGGACAVTAAWDGPYLIVVGDSETDMRIAVQRLIELQGGAAVVSGGVVKAQWQAELAGVLSLGPLAETVQGTSAVNRALADLGCVHPNSLLSIEALTTGVIPFLRLSAGGYVRFKDGARLGVDLE